jgi:hypothetical protein
MRINAGFYGYYLYAVPYMIKEAKVLAAYGNIENGRFFRLDIVPPDDKWHKLNR